MLLQFVVENFLSFRGKAVLSMLAAEGAEHAETHCLRLPGLPPVLKCAAVYGANASGKSNVVKAFDFVRRLVVEGTRAGEPIPLRRFKLDPASLSAPARFEVDLYAGGRRYSYGLVLTGDAVESEWLFVDEGGEDLPLFERARGEGSDRPSIELGPALSTDTARRQFMGFVAEGTRPNQLFLTEAAEHNVTELSPVTRWFREQATVTDPGTFRRLQVSEDLLIASAAFRDFLADLLRGAGTGISGVNIESPLKGSGWDPARSLHRVRLHHVSPAGAVVPFMFDEESSGTQRLVALAPLLFDLTQPVDGAPALHVIDELDGSLHPLLTRFFLQTFLRHSSPEHPGQLLFTTHDTNLLDLDVLSRDSIWFTEKDAGGATSLYSLAEFKGEQLDRLGAHLEEGYLHGRFGAIPFLGDPRRLGWRPADLG